MDKPISTVAREIAEAASVFEEQQTGHAPKSVTVVLSGETLVVTVDPGRINDDENRAKEAVQSLGHKAKEPARVPADKVTESERQPRDHATIVRC